MNQLSPIEAVLRSKFKLNVTISGLDSDFTWANLYVDGVYVTNTSITNNVAAFSIPSFSANVSSVLTEGDHTYSITATTTTSTTSGEEHEIIIYKNALKVYGPVSNN